MMNAASKRAAALIPRLGNVSRKRFQKIVVVD
jgi:hypothetical protein